MSFKNSYVPPASSYTVEPVVQASRPCALKITRARVISNFRFKVPNHLVDFNTRFQQRTQKLPGK